MSRLIVKNIPRHVTEKRLREHFSKQGNITDVKLMRTPDGVSRRFAFVGYNSDADAAAAQKYFNGTFIDTGKIIVELAMAVNDPNKERPWSKHSEGSSAYEKRHGSGLRKPAAADKPAHDPEAALAHSSVPKSIESDAKFKEFFEAMLPRSKQKLWSNVDGTSTQQSATASAPAKATAEAAAAEEPGADTGSKTGGLVAKHVKISGVHSRKLGGSAVVLKRMHVVFDSDDDDDDDNAGGPPASSSATYDEAIPQQPAALTAGARPGDVVFDDDDTDASDDDDYQMIGVPRPAGAASSSDSDSDGDMVESDDSDNEEASPAPPAADLIMGFDDEVDETGQLREPVAADAANAANAANATAPEDDHIDTDNVQDAASAHAQIAESGRLFVRNLAYTTTEADLRGLFQKFGPVASVHIPLSSGEARKSKGFAYILFMMPEHALNAYAELDRSFFQGRILHVLPARPARDTATGPDTTAPDGRPLSFKEKRLAERKANAGDVATWNSLFLNPDTVASAMADRLGVSKAQLLDSHRASAGTANAAVRLAQAEAQLVQETRQFLVDCGVSLDAFQGEASKRSAGRSDVCIIAKNMPYGVDGAQLQESFAKFGQLTRFIMPPTKTVALVEFSEPTEARAAFRKLAFSKVQDMPLYLEWAPAGTFTASVVPGAGPMVAIGKLAPEGAGSGATEPAAVRTTSESLVLADSSGTGQPAAEGTPAAAAAAAAAATAASTVGDSEGCTVFVKNLNFSTTDETLHTVFAAVGPLRSAQTTKKTTRSGEKLSMGFGFVEFVHASDASKAIQNLQGTTLDGHSLQLKLSHRKSGAGDGAESRKSARRPDAPAGSGTPSNKLVIRNVPFQATRQELRQLFIPHGTIRSLRLPRKFDGNHRGFAFIEFATESEAAAARAAVETHLYGRRLVIEWASTEDASVDADAAMHRAARDFEKANAVPTGRGPRQQSKKIRISRDGE
ncbi:hypothetical protein H696_04436 [Fonticula alba]|uniref:RRM domain-containing protein n=1 Tax=Fonticula alba TaxID=691883 RepID=A0A058Z4I6_FONAL|nr:hypothetical protein H696_04436 [Fonticula alba]KCV69016.1 hypothetical protein H696_04436 [Fonticula alba]|eukprot:XP_009496587.1 hypothetical protein H696_04436 [Fonticula alba]